MWTTDLKKTEYSVSDMTVEPNVTYLFDKQMQFLGAYRGPKHIRCDDMTNDDIPTYIHVAVEKAANG